MLDAYGTAVDSGEWIYHVGQSTTSRATEMAENAPLYGAAAFAAARPSRIAEGLLILERGKTRLLAEALRRRAGLSSELTEHWAPHCETSGERDRYAF